MVNSHHYNNFNISNKWEQIARPFGKLNLPRNSYDILVMSQHLKVLNYLIISPLPFQLLRNQSNLASAAAYGKSSIFSQPNYKFMKEFQTQPEISI